VQEYLLTTMQRIQVFHPLPMRTTRLSLQEAAAVFGGCSGPGTLCEDTKECCQDQNLGCRQLIYSAPGNKICKPVN
jgi:hypothetical protein